MPPPAYNLPMTESFLNDLDDPRLEPYRDLKLTNQSRRQEIFVAEGRFVVERLLQSDFPIESVLVSEKKRHLFPEEYLDRVSLMVLPHELMQSLVGFDFHHGFLACGLRKQEQKLAEPEPGRRSLLLACPHIADPDNLGTMIRLARAFGADALLVGDQCTDPFSRRSIRVSMGNIFSLPIIQPADLQETLKGLKTEWEYEVAATVLDDRAEPLMEESRAERLILIFGNEATGLDPRWLEIADRQVTIPMDEGTDSLNVALSAGIFLYHYTRVAR
ncbi:23S rRNA methyltransferase [Polystyrenella longa]|uniref:23S rRNA methyltransferase n=1 Tax=Polystyrenella longa TaxID=2528007 RepID=A0A518CSI6_9PLAN|nr:RNA methyltransferase [Polystyrenella longa]QDU82197.1 23S rRNA methyltransferase [Polystyrenella longa]